MAPELGSQSTVVSARPPRRKNRKLEADGVIGIKTWTALFSPGKATPQPKPKPKPKPNPGTYNNGRCPAGKGARNNDVVPNPNGCGPADGVPVPELNFNACCNAHDRCYSDCSKSKMKCDVTFLNCMYKRCDALYEDWWEVPARATCKGTAAVYYSAVERLGDGPFESATKKHCICS